MPRAFYSVGRRLLGTAEVSERALSTAYLCDRCGAIWATITVEGAPSWGFEFARCEAHPDPSRMRISGSMLRWPDITADLLRPENQAIALENFPPEALQREFVLHMNWHLKGAETERIEK